MSSDGECQPQPSKRRPLIVSDSDSSEDSIVGRTHKKRRVYRVVSDAETTDDDSDVPKPVRHRKNYKVVSDDDGSYSSGSETDSQIIEGSTSSEWQSDWESMSDESEPESVDVKRRRKAAKSSKSPKKAEPDDGAGASGSNAGGESDASDGQSEKCPICLLTFRKQEVATPSSCDHCFCFVCITEWSKNINTCPVDRQAFTVIHVRSKPGGKVIRHVPVETKTNMEEQIQEDPTYCEICHHCDREDRMLLCDGCDLGFHLECLNPPMNEVPMDEWFCPDCSRNSQDDAEAVPIDRDEISDLMAEARGLGVSYGRTRTGIPREDHAFAAHRIIPRTRQTERVRANIRAGRDRTRAREVRDNAARPFDPDQPSTSSSGMESISENSRSRSPNGGASGGGANATTTATSRARSSGATTTTTTTASRRATSAASSRTRARKTTRKTKRKRKVTTERGERMVREVRIVEYNADGEREEIVTYVNVAPTSTKRRKKRAKRSRKKRRARTVSSMAAAVNTAKKRLANTLGMVRRLDAPLLSGPSVKVRSTPTERGILSNSRNLAGITQVSLFGNNLGLDYSPPGSDDEFASIAVDGPVVGGAQRRSAASATRRRFALKGIANPLSRQEEPASSPGVVDLIGSILDSQEVWHSSKKAAVTLKADGTLLIENKSPERTNLQSVNNNESPIKKRENASGDEAPQVVETPLDLSSVNPGDITQAPMYNSPRGGGNRGNFRGGYRDGSRHSHGGNQGYGGRDSYGGGGGSGGRHSYGGSGARDNFGNRDFGPPVNYNPNFEHRGPPPFGGAPPFRNRNPQQQFRPQRMPMLDQRAPMFQPPPMDGPEHRPSFPHPNHFPRPRLPLVPSGPPPGMHPNVPPGLGMQRPPVPPPPPPPQQQQQQKQQPEEQVFREDFSTSVRPEPREEFPAAGANVANEDRPEERAEDEDCDIYCDIEAPKETEAQQGEANDAGGGGGGGGSVALLPPPEPPSGLLDFEEDNSKSGKDADSDQEDLVIDDTPKEETARPHDDKYDPFAADSDSNDSTRHGKREKVASNEGEQTSPEVAPLDPPPLPPDFPALEAQKPEQQAVNPLLRLTAYDDDDDEEDSQDDCPNFSIYSSASMDVARHAEQEMSQQIGPLEPPPLPPDIPDDDDVIVGDVQSCDLADIPEPSDPYVEALRKERQTLSRIPPKKITSDTRGKITFKIGNKFKINNKLSNLYDELDENIEVSIEQEKEIEEKRNSLPPVETAKKDREDETDKEIFSTKEGEKEKEKEKEKDKEQEREKKSDAEDNEESETSDKEERKNAEAKDSDGENIEDKDKSKASDLEDENDSAEEDDEKPGKSEKESAAKDSEDDEDEDGENEKPSKPRKSKESVTIDLTEKSCDTTISIAESVARSPKDVAARRESRGDDASADERDVDEAKSRDASDDDDDEKMSDDQSDSGDKRKSRRRREQQQQRRRRRRRRSDASAETSDVEDRGSSGDEGAKNAAKTSYPSSVDQNRAGASSSFDVDDETENFPLEKETVVGEKPKTVDQEAWESDGAYTPCKDERPVKEKENRGSSLSPFESGLEPITPTKDDPANDDLDGCRTPVGYAGLGTEAISETDEAMNFEDETTSLNLRKDKDMEDGEIRDDGKASSKKHAGKSSEVEDGKRKRKKKEKEKSKETEKNKENISTSENQVAWKKISKSTKERQYRDKDKRSRSRDRDKDKEKDKDKGKPKKKVKETTKKKEKRKELPRYDVRKIVAEKPARPRKDEYGRDVRDYSRSKSRSRSLSRQRSPSRDRRSRSYSRIRSRTRSRSRGRRSWSRGRRSASKSRGSVSKGRRSMSKGRRSLSKGRRSLSKGRRSLSRALGAISKGGRRSISKGRRSVSKGRRSPSRRRSVSRGKRKRSTSRRSLSKKRSVSRRRTKSPARRRRSLSPRRRRCSATRKHRSRSRDKRKDKKKQQQQQQQQQQQHKSRSRSRNRKRSRSKSPKRAASKSREKKHAKRKPASRSRSKHRSLSRARDRNRNWNPIADKPAERHFSREKDQQQRESWSAQWTPSWSRSNSPVATQLNDIPTHSWSPPPALDGVAVPPKNLTVILTNKEAIKKKKKEKRKESKKTRGETERRKKTKRTRTPPPSKEVFASGDNILVSVCFNKDNETSAPGATELPESSIPLLAPVKRRRREPLQTEPAKKPKKDRTKEKRAKSPKAKKEKKKKSRAAEIAATKKPVAVIDLDQSPFREQTPSPRDIIVLSDDDDKQPAEPATPEQHPRPSSPPQHEQFVSQGPKTPPEPQIKFSINKQTSNLRPSMMNPLLEEEEEEEEEIDERVEEELEMRAQEELELRLKIGPNTPPEPPSSPPTSPDAYDPFDPTKSRSPTPTVSQEATPNDERNQRSSPRKQHDAGDGTPTAGEQQTQQQEPINAEKQQTEKPKIISVMTIKRATSPKRDAEPAADGQTETVQILDSPTKAPQNQQNAQSAVNPFATINPVLATVAAAVQRSAIFNTSTPIAGQRNLQQPNRISPSTQIKQRANERPQLPNLFANPAKPTPVRMQKAMQNKNMSTLGQNGSDATLDLTNDNVDMSSPYSPGSSLSDGIFDPPSPGNHNGSPANVPAGNKSGTSKNSKPADKKDAFDSLFGSSPAMKSMSKGRNKKAIEKEKRSKKSTNPKVGVRMDENQLQILDDLPSSAVEMQVKDKFLKKLNRQERVVEEVKLVLKPHYTKKHVTKEEYKDIMRKAVPKICHNKTGEINPKKIAQLIEAYVRKCRSGKKKKPPAAPVNSAAKTAKPAKNLWS